MLDIENLLRKYIRHVGDEEGTDFINDWMMESGDFSPEEYQVLYNLSGRPFPTEVSTLERSISYSTAIKELLLKDLETLKEVKVIKL